MLSAKSGDWRTEPLPARFSSVPLDRVFSTEQMQRIRAGLIPRQMEDKWFVYWEEDALFFHRSWTGFCIYVVRFTEEGECSKMVDVQVNGDPEQCSGIRDGHDREMISYLIDVLLLHLPAAFPSEETDQQERAVANWAQVGRAMLGEGPGST